MKLKLVEKLNLLEFESNIRDAAERQNIVDDIEKAFKGSGYRCTVKDQHKNNIQFAIHPKDDYLFKITMERLSNEKDPENKWKITLNNYKGKTFTDEVSYRIEEGQRPEEILGKISDKIKEKIAFPTFEELGTKKVSEEFINEASIRGIFDKIAQKIVNKVGDKDETWSTFVENALSIVDDKQVGSKLLKTKTLENEESKKLVFTINPTTFSPFIITFSIARNINDKKNPYLINAYGTPLNSTTGLSESLSEFLDRLGKEFNININPSDNTLNRTSNEKPKTKEYFDLLMDDITPSARELMDGISNESLNSHSDKILNESLTSDENIKLQQAYEDAYKSDNRINNPSTLAILKLLIYKATDGKKEDSYKGIIENIRKYTARDYNNSILLDTNKVLKFVTEYLKRNNNLGLRELIIIADKLRENELDSALKMADNGSPYDFIYDENFWKNSSNPEKDIEAFVSLPGATVKTLLSKENINTLKNVYKFPESFFSDKGAKNQLIAKKTDFLKETIKKDSSDGKYRSAADVEKIIKLVGGKIEDDKLNPDPNAKPDDVRSEIEKGEFKNLIVLLKDLKQDKREALGKELLKLLQNPDLDLGIIQSQGIN